MHFKADGKSSLPPFKCVDPWTETVGNVADLQLATAGLGEKRCLKYSN